MRHCVGAGLLFCSLLGLWFVGIVPSFGMIIGIFLLLGFVATINYIKSSSVGKVAILFYVALIAFITLDAIYSLVPQPIKEEVGAIRRSETIKAAERLHQPGGETFQMIREQCKVDFDKGLKDAGDRLHQSTSPDKTDELIQDIQKLEERRGKCSNAILKLGEKGSVGETTDNEKLKFWEEETNRDSKGRVWLKVITYKNTENSNQKFFVLYFGELLVKMSMTQTKDTLFLPNIYRRLFESGNSSVHFEVEKNGTWYTGKFLDKGMEKDSNGDPLLITLTLQDEQGKEVVKRYVAREDSRKHLEMSPQEILHFQENPVRTDSRGDTTIDITKQSQDAKKRQTKKR